MRLSFKSFVPALLAGSFLVACGGGGSVPETPDGVAKAVFEGIGKNKPGILWQAMPASYQTDINDVVHTFGGKLDEELYNKVLGVAGKVNGILRDKKTFILNSPMFQIPENPNGVTKDTIAENWDGMVNSIDILLKSDLSTVAGIKSMDVGNFLSKTIGDLMAEATKKQPLPMDFTKASATLVSSAGDKAVINVTPPGGCESPDGIACKPQDLSMVKVEGKWVPEDMANGWSAGIAGIREQLNMMDPAQVAAQKPQIMAVLAMVDGALAQIANASTQDEFNTAIGGIMAMAGGAMGADQGMDAGQDTSAGQDTGAGQ